MANTHILEKGKYFCIWSSSWPSKGGRRFRTLGF